MAAVGLLSAGLVAAVATQAGAVGAPAGATMTASAPQAANGTSVAVSGTDCVNGSSATVVLVKLLSPGGALVSSAAATVQRGGGTSTFWYASLTVPATAPPSPYYEFTASCRSNGKPVFAYLPIALDVTSNPALNLTVSPDAAAPGTTLAVAGAACLPQPGVPSSAEAVLVDPDGYAEDADAAASSTSGSWTTTLQVPTGATPGVWQVTATCDNYYSSATTYLAHTISVGSPAGAAPTALTWTGPTSAPAGSVTTLRARLTSTGAPVTGLPVTFTLGSVSSTVRTEPDGEATALVKAPTGSGTTATATFTGGSGQTSGFSSASTSVAFGVTAGLAATKLTVSAPASTPAEEPNTLTATLTRPSGAPVTGRPVTFEVSPPPGYGGGTAVATLTDASGTATLHLPGSDWYAYGAFTIRAVFPAIGDPTFAPAESPVATTQVTPAISPSGAACADSTHCTVVDFSGRARYSIDGGLDWLPSSVPTAIEGFHGVACTTAGACVAVGGDIFGGSAANDALVHSGDSGATWSATLTATGQHFLSIACMTATRCVAVGDAVEVTSDGGTSWQAGTLPASVTFSDVACGASSACLALGTTSTGGAVTYTTADGGSTWSYAGATPFSNVAGDHLACSAPTQCTATGFSFNYLETTGDGVTWTPVLQGVTGGPVACAGSLCAAVGAYYNQPLYSTDGGITWSAGSGSVGQTYGYPRLGCVAGLCLATGYNYEGPVAASRSTDGGKTYTPGGTL